jgi:hypothetical protein
MKKLGENEERWLNTRSIRLRNMSSEKICDSAKFALITWQNSLTPPPPLGIQRGLALPLCLVFVKMPFLTSWREACTLKLNAIGTCIHYVSRSWRKKTELAWRRNLQNDVREDSVENPDFLSLAELGFWFIAKRQGSWY